MFGQNAGWYGKGYVFATSPSRTYDLVIKRCGFDQDPDPDTAGQVDPSDQGGVNAYLREYYCDHWKIVGDDIVFDGDGSGVSYTFTKSAITYDDEKLKSGASYKFGPPAP